MLLLAEDKNMRKTKTISTGIGFTPNQLKKEFDVFINETGIEPEIIGMAIPGLVNEKGEVVACDVLPNIVGIDASLLNCRGAETFFVNDVEAGLYSEMVYMEGISDAVLIMAGTGIGMAIMINGKVFKGSAGWAGELGSIPLQIDGKICTLDEVASGAAILNKLGCSINEIAKISSRERERFNNIIGQAGAGMGMGVATVVNILNPQEIIIGGGTLAYPGYFEAVIQTAEKYSLPQLFESCVLRRTKEEKLSVSLGAIEYARLKIAGHF